MSFGGVPLGLQLCGAGQLWPGLPCWWAPGLRCGHSAGAERDLSVAVPSAGAAARRQRRGDWRQQGEGKWPLVAGDVSPPRSWQWVGTALLRSRPMGATCCWGGGLCSQALGMARGAREEARTLLSCWSRACFHHFCGILPHAQEHGGSHCWGERGVLRWEIVANSCCDSGAEGSWQQVLRCAA